jgi:predicted RNase H-like HicB family nuclease
MSEDVVRLPTAGRRKVKQLSTHALRAATTETPGGDGLVHYPVELAADDNGTLLAIIPGLPGATYGSNEAEALANALNLLATVGQAFADDGLLLPAPEPTRGRQTIGYRSDGN